MKLYFEKVLFHQKFDLHLFSQLQCLFYLAKNVIIFDKITVKLQEKYKIEQTHTEKGRISVHFENRMTFTLIMRIISSQLFSLFFLVLYKNEFKNNLKADKKSFE